MWRLTVAGALEKEALLAEASMIISSIKSYNDEGGEFKDKRAIGRGFANLNKAISKQEDLVSAIAALKRFTRQMRTLRISRIEK